jgi:hypothetical protein
MMTMRRRSTFLLSLVIHQAVSFSAGNVPTSSEGINNSVRLFARRSFLASLMIAIPLKSEAVVQPPRSVVEVGGGFDLISGTSLGSKDVVYPQSMEGVWNCERVVTQSEGDSYMAETAWRSLGGGRLLVGKPETFQARFIKSTKIGDSGVVLDRGFEVASRTGSNTVNWNVEQPDVLQFDKIQLCVVQRSVELPSDKGFGFKELYRIEEGPFTRAAQVKRRYRRAFDENGNRVVEGLEIMKTFRVLDNVAGTEKPTSTTKAQIRLTRP